MNLHEFGKRLARRRRELDLSQQHLAEKLGTTRQYISILEKGERSCSLELLVKIADLLGASTDYLLRGKENYIVSDLELVIRAEKRLNEESKRVLISLVKILP